MLRLRISAERMWLRATLSTLLALGLGFRRVVLRHAASEMIMHDDEKAIRNLINDWQEAATTGDVDRLQRLMSDDVVFLTPGQPPLCGRQVFLDSFKEGLKHYRIESHGEIKDMCITADLAYCWAYLSITAIPYQRGLPVRRSGNTLSVLRKHPDTGWVIVRDANMLTPQPVVMFTDTDGASA